MRVSWISLFTFLKKITVLDCNSNWRNQYVLRGDQKRLAKLNYPCYEDIQDVYEQEQLKLKNRIAFCLVYLKVKVMIMYTMYVWNGYPASALILFFDRIPVIYFIFIIPILSFISLTKKYLWGKEIIQYWLTYKNMI